MKKELIELQERLRIISKSTWELFLDVDKIVRNMGDTEKPLKIKRYCNGFVIGKFPDDTEMRWIDAQKCWGNHCWMIGPDNESNPVMIAFYSKERDRIQDEKVYDIAENTSLELYSNVYNHKGSPIMHICWNDYLPPCGMFTQGGLSMTWTFYEILGTDENRK